MANNNANVTTIDLKSQLITTQNKNAILPFNGFKKRNSPFLNGGLKHFNLDVGAKQLLDKNGNSYRYENGTVYRNNVAIKTCQNTFIKVEEIKLPVASQLSLNQNILYITPYIRYKNGVTEEYFFVQTETHFYLYQKSGTTYTQWYDAPGTYKILSGNNSIIAFEFYGTEVNIISIIYDYYPNHVEFTLTNNITEKGLKGLNWTVRLGTMDETIEGVTAPVQRDYFVGRAVSSNGAPFDVDPTDTDTVEFFYFSPAKPEMKGIGTIDGRLFFEGSNIVNPVPDIKNTVDTTNLDINHTSVTSTLNNLKERGRTVTGSTTFINGVITPGSYQNKTVYFPKYQGTMDHYVGYDSESDDFHVENEFTASYSKFECEGIKVLIGDDFIKYTNYISFQPATQFFQYHADYGTEESAESDYSLAVYGSPKTRGDKKYFTNFYDGYGVIFLGGGCTTISEDNTFNFSQNFTKLYGSDFQKVYTANTFAGLSWCGKIIENWLSIDSDYVRPIYYVYGNGLPYDGFLYQKNNKWYKVYETDNASIKLIYNRYLLVLAKLTGNDVYNCYDTVTDTWYNYASDWNNRVLIGRTDNINYQNTSYRGEYALNTSNVFSIEIATGENVNWTRGNISTALWQPVIYNNCLWPEYKNGNITDSDFIDGFIHLRYEDTYVVYKQSEELYFSTTLNGNEAVSTPYYVANYNNAVLTVDEATTGKIYPVSEGNLILNTSLMTDFIQTAFNAFYIKNDTSYYQLITQNSAVLLCYAYGTALQNINEMFNLQGIPYIIQNDYICSCTISNNIVSNVMSLISCQYLRFLGASLDKAYLYSEADKKIYIFTGDRRLYDLCEYSGIGDIVTSFFSVFLNTFFIIVEDKVICITNDEYIYEIEGEFTDYQELEKGIAFFTETLSYYYSIYDGTNAKKIEAETAFYGVGENKVSIIDTWYLKLFSANSANGSIKLKVTSLSNIGTESEETELVISKDMWDEMTNTYYLRYQPKLQRGIGVSLSIESDFDLIDLKCSYTVDNNASQLSKPFVSSNVITGGKI